MAKARTYQGFYCPRLFHRNPFGEAGGKIREKKPGFSH